MNPDQLTSELFIAILSACRRVVEVYIDKSKVNEGMGIAMETCLTVEKNLKNYITLLNTILNKNASKGCQSERIKWRTELEPHVMDICCDRFAVLGDYNKPVIIKREPPNSPSIYEINLTAIYRMSSDVVILTDRDNRVSDMRRNLQSSLVNLMFDIFKESRPALRTVKDKYSPDMSSMKFLDEIISEVPDLLKSQLPDNDIDTGVITQTIKGLLPKPGESEEDVRNKIKNNMNMKSLTKLMESIQK